MKGYEGQYAASSSVAILQLSILLGFGWANLYKTGDQIKEFFML